MSANTDRAKGKLKQVAGTAAHNKRLQREGKVDQAGARVKQLAADAKSMVDDVVDDAKDRVRKGSSRK
jgi:uncharacterized protein YjbJ (UPF0337 family)